MLHKHTFKTDNGKIPAAVPITAKTASTPKNQAFTPAVHIHVKFADTSAKNTPSELSEFLQEVREYKYKLRSQIGEVLTAKLGKSSVLGCGRYRTSSDIKTIPVAKSKHGSISFHGLQTCKSVWLCPVCSFKIAAKRASELQPMFEAAINQGYTLGFLTLTLPHNKTEALRDLQNNLLKAWRNITNCPSYKGQTKYKGTTSDHSIKHRFGVAGFVRAYETKYGHSNGWHPHLHFVFAFNKHPLHPLTGCPLPDDELGHELINRWAAEVFKLTGKHVNKEKSCKWESVASLENLSEYMAKGGKWTLAKELTYANEKTDTQHNQLNKRFTPFELIEEYLKDTEQNAKYLPLFLQYAAVSKGRSSLFISKEFKTSFAPDQPDITDEEILNEDIDTILLEVESLLHRSMVDRYIDGSFLNVIEYKPDTLTAFMDQYYKNRYIISETETGNTLIAYTEDAKQAIKAEKQRKKQQQNLKQLARGYAKKHS